MSREIDIITTNTVPVNPVNGFLCATNLNSSKYSTSYHDHSALINESTGKINFGYIMRDTEVPVIENHHQTFASSKNSQELVLLQAEGGGGEEEGSAVKSNRDIIFSSTSTIRAPVANGGRVIATSFTELPVGVTCDTRRARSEPGSLSMTVITREGISKQLSTAVTTTTTAPAASIDGLDSLVTKRSGQQLLITTPVISASKNQLTSSHPENFNSSGENESDYVVDPAQGNAYYKGPFLGKGGFARVYLMTDIANGKRYACKIIPKNRMQKIHIQKIAREIMIHKGLNHINVVQMHHYFEDSLNVYMLLEACPRKSLMHVLKYRGKVTEPEARYYMKQMVTGVAYIHSQKVVHRDLKPGNMFLSEGMIVKIGDFGLATRPDGQRRRVTICGTPNYIAPEVLYKQAYSYEADVWALGCILYALLAGQPPFDTATLKETYSKICNNRYKKLSDNVISKNGQDLIKWLLQPIPELRPSLETVKDHPYLAMEFVPERLAHSCCYRPPDINLYEDKKHETLLAPPSTSFPSATSLLSSTSCTSTVSRRERTVQLPQIGGGTTDPVPKFSIRQIETTAAAAANDLNTKFMENPRLNGKDMNKDNSKVGHWLVRKFPKLTKLRKRLFGNILCPDRKKSLENIVMHHALETCLSEIKTMRTNKNPLPVSGLAPLFVTKWIDYSNKYGLCFQLSDRSVGVLFNDSTKMSYTRDRRRVEYTDVEDQITRYARVRDVPSLLHEKLELLRHFTEYMDDHLTNGGEINDNSIRRYPRRNGSVPRMRRWLRTDRAIVMELTVPLLQVNFFADHTKIVVSEGTPPKDYFVTYVDANRYTTTYRLSDLREGGCTSELYERLNYVCRASKEFAHLENNLGCSEISINRKTGRKS